MNKRPSPEWHRRQIEKYAKAFPIWQLYATAMKRVLDHACARAVPEAMVQARPKSLASFAEKCVRKWPKCKNPAEDLTDLCGGRVIVHTLDQVVAVRAFIDRNFTVVERDDKSAALQDDKFGYRDLHFLVRLNAERTQAIGFSKTERAAIGDRVAELQVRTVVQHAWADILHNRLYKAPLKLSKEARRTGALLAAIMEDGDRSFDRLAGELDGMAANYAAYAKRNDVKAEIEVQELILKNTKGGSDRLPVALRLARLLAPCGEYRKVVDMLDPLRRTESALRHELLLELGHALCRLFRRKPESADYTRGRDYVREVVEHCSSSELTLIPSYKKTNSLLARALSRLAWITEALDRSQNEPHKLHRRALETEPGNPYHLANQLSFDVFCAAGSPALDSMTTQIRAAIATCRDHAIAGTELPFAHFTAGRLELLLGNADDALGWYARGLRHLFDEQSCVPVSVLDDEVEWIERIHFGGDTPKEYGWVKRLISLALHFHPAHPAAKKARPAQGGADRAGDGRVLIVAGGALTMERAMLRRVEPLMDSALRHFRGTVISGGTRVGIPGCVGDVTARLKSGRKKAFKLIGYIPKNLPSDAPRDARYDSFVTTDDDGFSSGQILRMWEDFRDRGITPDLVQLLGIGGGALTAVEFRVALALGASTAAVHCTGGAADALLNDPVWLDTTTLVAMPLDPASAQAFVTAPTHQHKPERLLRMAQSFHEHYVNENPKKLPENLRPWGNLPATYQTANLEQARYAVEILRAAGFDVRRKSGKRGAIQSFADKQWRRDVERMAELEHGRWNIERLRNGWRFGRPRDDARKIHDCLVPWENLPEEIREFDRNGVRAFPDILAKAGLGIFRP